MANDIKSLESQTSTQEDMELIELALANALQVLQTLRKLFVRLLAAGTRRSYGSELSKSVQSQSASQPCLKLMYLQLSANLALTLLDRGTSLVTSTKGFWP